MRKPLPPFRPDMPVSVVGCKTYEKEEVRSALLSLLAPLGGLSFVQPGVTVAIKANLVAGLKPEKAATTHPVLLEVLAEEIGKRGGTAVIGDSPGGLYNAAALSHVYSTTGLRMLEREGVTLNRNFGERTAAFPEGKVLKSLTYTAYLDECDYIINFAKLKSHGMMGMSCAAKNLFGAVPGLLKPEYHYRFPEHPDFADMLLDLDEYFRPVLSIADAVVAMEGNGPTAGEPRLVGCLLASASPHCLDLAAASILGRGREIPTLEAAYRRGMIPEKAENLVSFGTPAAFAVPDFKNIATPSSLSFAGSGNGAFTRFKKAFLGKILSTRPELHKDLCVGCGVCRDICPAKAIAIQNKKAVIDRDKCIRCFCCQEFCPKSAMKVKKSLLMQFFHRKENKERKK